MKRTFLAMAVCSAAAVSGCAQDDQLRTEGLTMTAGDAIARNSALQIIDPWPEGVEDTDLLVPNDRGGGKDKPADVPAPPVAPNP